MNVEKLGVKVHPRYGYCPKCNQVRELVPTRVVSAAGNTTSTHFTCRNCAHVVEIRMAS